MVEADHKPLESLFKKTQSVWHSSAFSEHERMMLRTCIYTAVQTDGQVQTW